MPKYSIERKESVLLKLLHSGLCAVAELSLEEVITVQTHARYSPAGVLPAVNALTRGGNSTPIRSCHNAESEPGNCHQYFPGATDKLGCEMGCAKQAACAKLRQLKQVAEGKVEL